MFKRTHLGFTGVSKKNIPFTVTQCIVDFLFDILRFFINNCSIVRSPYVCDGLFVFVVCGPYCYFIPFGSDVNDGSTHVVTVVVKSFTHKAQELQEKHIISICFVTGEQFLFNGCWKLMGSFQRRQF